MQNINNIVQNFLKKHKNNQRYIFVLILLSVMVIAIVCSSLITPAVSMTGELSCQKEQHTHSEDCYAEILICTEDADSHYHSENCYTTQTELVCGLEEDENHMHSNECYNTEKKLNCDKQENEPHTHTDECYEKQLVCGKEEHTHTDECYKTLPEETENINEAEKEAEEIEISKEAENDSEVIVIDPIDAEFDSILNSVKVKISNSKTINTYSVNGNVTIIDEISVDFGNFINNITHKEVAGNSGQENVKTVKFTINYNLPENTLMNNNTNRQIHCLLPDNVVITEDKSGIVRKEGQEIGTYQITSDGYIIIEFDQNFVKDGGSAITGDISFNADVYKTDDSSSYETVTIGRVSVNIPFLQETVPSNDLSVSKSYGGYDRSTKKVSYKIEIISYNGSGDGNITVTDSFPSYIDGSLIHLDWNDGDTAVFTKKASDGSSSEVSGTVSVADDGTVTITGLPALGANESYSITYTATLTPGTQDTLIKADNTISVTNGTLTDESVCYAEVAVSCGITKEGKYNDRTDMVEWTITVTNPFGDSLDGYSISDDMLGIAVNGLKIKDANGSIIETLDDSNLSGTTGSLDKSTNTFSFSASANGTKYILAYETKLPDRSAIADNTVSNKAVLKNGSSEINAPQANASIWSDRQKVSKSYRASSYDASGNVVIDWLAKLEFQIGDINGQIYKDTMSADSEYHYMTSQQKDTLNIVGYKADYNSVNLEKDTDYTVKWYNSEGNEITNDTENIYSFEIVFADSEKISELCDIYIYYSATGITENMTAGSERIYSNKAEFAGIESSAQYREYKKEPFNKYDGSISGQASNNAETYHNTNDLEKDENGNVILKWYIDANESRYFPADTDAVLTDTLPAGTVINENSIRYGNWSLGYYSLVENHTMTYTISENEDGRQVVIFTVPASEHNGNQFRIDYTVTVSEEYMRQNKDVRGRTPFKNTVTDGVYISEQTQVIERSLISKSGDKSSDSYDGYINYSIDINPKAELLSNNGKITVSDKINYQYNAFVPTLVEIKIYSVETDGNGDEQLTELDPSKYNLSYSNDGADATFTVELPDKTHLKINYRYYCVYKNPEWFENHDNGVDIYNSVVLDYDGNTQNTSFSNRYYLNNESSAHAVTDDYLKIEKVDSENYGVKLSGAEFSLYKWDGSQWLVMTNITNADDGGKIPEWSVAPSEDSDEDEQNVTPYTISTGSDGKAMLPEIETGTLYKIVEVNAPADYIKSSQPWYFAENTTPSSLPSEVGSGDIKILLKGGIIIIPNDLMQKTEIEVQKFWHDPPDFSGTHDEVEVELFQSKTDPSGKVNGPLIQFNFSDNSGTSIIREFNIEVGSDLEITIRSRNAWFQTWHSSITMNNEDIENSSHFSVVRNNVMDNNPYDENWHKDYTKYSEYKIIYSNVTEDMTFNVYIGETWADERVGPTDYRIYTGETEVGGPVTGIPDDAVSVGTAILSNENNWSYTWDDIPATDEFGYNYYYYVRENTTVTSYTPSYENNGANKGVIYITNKGEGYTNEMPATGGTGNKPVMIIGITLMSASTVFYIISKRRRTRQGR